jgi:signal transduction histidine kinase
MVARADQTPRRPTAVDNQFDVSETTRDTTVASARVNPIAQAEELLAELSEQIGADFAAVLLPARASVGMRLLAGNGALFPGSWQPDEPVVVRPATFLAGSPCASRDVHIHGVLDSHEVALASAVSAPMAFGRRRGWIAFGASAPQSLTDGAGLQEGSARLEGIMEFERLRREHQVYGQVIEGARRLDRALVTGDVEALLHGMVVTARDILHTDAAYLAVPDSDDDSSYVMAAFANVRTSSFRRLRLGHGDGLGGLARERLRPILTVDYLKDSRLKNPPVEAALREGFRSAISTPLLLDGNTIGSLYVANRSDRKLSEEDAEMLHLFGQHATAALASIRAQDVRNTLARLREREEFAYELHDNVMRALVEISLDAELSKLTGSPEQSLKEIGQHARATLEWLRTNLSSDAEQPTPPTTVAALCRALRAEAGHLRLTVTSSGPELPLEPSLATCLAAIAREAMHNAEVHSHGSSIEVRVDVGDREIRLRVSDDGDGLSEGNLEDSRHFGLRAMQRRVGERGGSLSLQTSAAGGLAVEAVFPTSR